MPSIAIPAALWGTVVAPNPTAVLRMSTKPSPPQCSLGLQSLGQSESSFPSAALCTLVLTDGGGSGAGLSTPCSHPPEQLGIANIITNSCPVKNCVYSSKTNARASPQWKRVGPILEHSHPTQAACTLAAFVTFGGSRGLQMCRSAALDTFYSHFCKEESSVQLFLTSTGTQHTALLT